MTILFLLILHKYVTDFILHLLLWQYATLSAMTSEWVELLAEKIAILTYLYSENSSYFEVVLRILCCHLARKVLT